MGSAASAIVMRTLVLGSADPGSLQYPLNHTEIENLWLVDLGFWASDNLTPGGVTEVNNGHSSCNCLTGGNHAKKKNLRVSCACQPVAFYSMLIIDPFA